MPTNQQIINKAGTAIQTSWTFTAGAGKKIYSADIRSDQPRTSGKTRHENIKKR